MDKGESINILLSYPRSGANWTRFLIEYFSDWSTMAEHKQENNKNSYPLHHNFSEIDSTGKSDSRKFYHIHGYKNHNDTKLILVVRNYKECIVRHNYIRHLHITPEIFIDIKQQLTDIYIKALSVYDKYPGDKLYIEYENLIDDELIKIEIQKICDFLSVTDSKNKINSFMENIDKFRKLSSVFYKRLGPTITDGKTRIFHTDKLTLSQQQEMDEIVKDYPHLYNTYLKKYEL